MHSRRRNEEKLIWDRWCSFGGRTRQKIENIYKNKNIYPDMIALTNSTNGKEKKRKKEKDKKEGQQPS